MDKRTETASADQGRERTLRGGLAAAILSVPAAYYYVDQVLIKADVPGGPRGCIQALVFTLIYAAAVELWTGAQERDLAGKERYVPAESRFWLLCLLAEGAGFAISGVQGGSRGFWQVLLWHVTAVLYVLARTGQFTAGRSGIFTGRDLLQGFLVLPWTNYLLRIRTLVRGIAEAVGRRRERAAQKGEQGQAEEAEAGTVRAPSRTSGAALVVLSIVLAAFLGLYAWGQLAAASSSFARLGEWLLRPVDSILRFLSREWDAFLDVIGEKLAILLLSLPVGAWLYGLVGGALKREPEAGTADRIRADLEKRRRIPALTLYLTAAVLTAVYVLFFCVQAAEVAARMLPAGGGDVITPFSAMTFAVSGFWELCRILLLNLAVLAVSTFFCRRSPLEGGPARIAGLALILCSLALALLNAAKLALYIRLCGYTPRRIVAGWVLLVLMCCVWIAGLRLFRTFNAAGLAIRLTAVSLALLCCLGIEPFCIRDNLARYTAGIENAPDTALLEECRFDAQGEVLEYTQILLDAGWFPGRDSDEIYQLYGGILVREDTWSYWPDDGSAWFWEIPLRRPDGGTRILRVNFDGGSCTGAGWE